VSEGGKRKGLFVALLLVVLFLGVGVFDHEIWSPTEPAVAGVVREMAGTGNLAVPRINGFLYLEKPPLYYWLALGACRIGGGLDAGWLRLPAALAGLLALLVVYRSSRRRFGGEVALLLTLLTATSAQFFMHSHRAAIDSLTVLFGYAAFAAFMRTLPGPDEEPPPSTIRSDLLLAAVLGAAFYAKSFLTAYLVLPPVVIFLVSRRRFRRAATICALTAAFTAVAILPWLLAVHRDGGWESIRVIFVGNTVGRFLDLDPGSLELGELNDAWRTERGESPFLYLTLFPVLPAPWTMILIAALVALLRKRRAGEFRHFLKIALIAVPIALSISSTKAGNYLDPLLIVAVMAIGDLFADLRRRPESVPRWARGLVAANLWVVAAVLALAPIGLAVTYGGWIAPLLGAILVVGLVLIYRLVRDRPLIEKSGRLLLFGTLALGTTALAAIPHLDERKSEAPFFREIEDIAAKR